MFQWLTTWYASPTVPTGPTDEVRESLVGPPLAALPFPVVESGVIDAGADVGTPLRILIEEHVFDQ
jgi:hypothetical protein